ncbi:MAG: hypothetical protein R3309_05615 [Reinekea sp.]|nr:hypothetical protein [Reinekea sp.]
MIQPDVLSQYLPLNIIIGAGEQSYDGWLATGKESLDLLCETDWVKSFSERKADRFLCEHVWEHLTVEQGIQAARYCFDALRPGGLLRVAVPDGYFPDAEYQRLVQVGGPGPADHPAADHKVVYNHQTFSEVFNAVGFQVDLLEYCDERGRFHYHQWDYQTGPIYRSLLSDHRNSKDGLGFTSLVLDAIKPR